MSLTILIIITTAIVSYLAFKDDQLLNRLLLWPAKMKQHVGQYYRLLTAGFVHGDTMHLLFNMITLYFFGEQLEQYLAIVFGMGYWGFLLLYLLGIIVASIPSAVKQQNNPGYRSLGASGGVAAVVFSVIYISPWSKLYIFFAIPMPSILFAVIYLAYTAYMARKGGARINHDAHLWGSLFGLLFMLIIDPTHGHSLIQQLSHPAF